MVLLSKVSAVKQEALVEILLSVLSVQLIMHLAINQSLLVVGLGNHSNACYYNSI